MIFSRLIHLSCVLFLFIFTSGCSSARPDPDKIQKITPKEYAKLCEFAKTTIASYNEALISKNDKKIITATEPKFNANYSADKSGTYDLSWNINGKVVNYLGNGDMTDPKNSFDRIIVITTSVGSPKN